MTKSNIINNNKKDRILKKQFIKNKGHKQETEGGKILSYVFDDRSFRNILTSKDINQDKIKSIIESLNNYVLKTNFSKVILIDFDIDIIDDEYYLWVKCFYDRKDKHLNKEENRIWKIGKRENIINEKTKYELIKDKNKGVLPEITDSLKNKEKTAYYYKTNYQYGYQITNEYDYLILEYKSNYLNQMENYSTLSQYIDKSLSSIKKPHLNIIDAIYNERNNKVKTQHIYNKISDSLNNIYNYRGLKSFYDVKKIKAKQDDENQNSSHHTIQRLLGYYPPADLIIKKARIITEKERRKRPDYLSTYKSDDFYHDLKSEIPITIYVSDDNVIEKITGKDFIRITDIEGRRYDVKHNTITERDTDILSIRREIKSAKDKQKNLNLIIIGVETGRKHTELDKIFNGLIFDEKEKKEMGIHNKNKFIEDYIDLINRKIEIEPSSAMTLHNLSPNRLFVDQNGKNAFTYDCLNIRRGDIASDFTKNELELKMNFFSDMAFSDDKNENDNVYTKAYNIQKRAELILSIESYLSGEDETNLSNPIKKDTICNDNLFLYGSIRKNYLEVMNEYGNEIDLIREYYYSLLVNSISIMDNLFEEYNQIKDRNQENRFVTKLNMKRKMVYYLANFYLYKIIEIEDSINDDNNTIEKIISRWDYSNSEQDNLFTENDIKINERLNKGLCLINNAYYEQAIKTLNEEEKNPDVYQTVLLLKAYSSFLNDDYDKAYDYYTELYQESEHLTPISNQSLLGIADSLYQLGRYKEALEHYTKLIEVDTITSDTLYRGLIGKASSLIKINRTLDSVNLLEDFLNKHIEQFDQNMQFFIKTIYAEANRILGKLETAEKLFNELVSSNMENTNAINGLGLSYIHLGEHVKAEDAFQASIFINSDPITNYIAYKGLRDSILMEPSQKDTSDRELSLTDRIMFQKAYNCAFILDKINHEYNLPRIFKYSMTDRSKDSRMINIYGEDTEEMPEWMKPPVITPEYQYSKKDNTYQKSDDDKYVKTKSESKKETQTEKPQFSSDDKDKLAYKKTLPKEKILKEEHKSDIENLLHKANELFYNNKYDDAINLYERLKRENQLDIESLFNYANSLFKIGKYRKAIGVYLCVYERDNKNIKALVNTGISYNKLKEYNHAIKIFDYILKLKPDLEKVKYNKALSLLGLKKYNQSLDILNAIKLSHKEIKDKLYEIYFYKGLALYKLGEIADTGYFIDALSCFNKSYRINPEYSIAATYIAKTRIMISKEEPEAIKGSFKTLNKAYKIEKSKNKLNDETLTAMGKLLLKSRDLHHAKIAFEKAIQINKHNYYAILGLGDSYYLNNSLNDAISCYDKLIINIDDKYTENKILKTIALKRKVRATYKNADYLECLSTIGKLKYKTGALSLEFRKLREHIIKSIDKNDIF